MAARLILSLGPRLSLNQMCDDSSSEWKPAKRKAAATTDQPLSKQSKKKKSAALHGPAVTGMSDAANEEAHAANDGARKESLVFEANSHLVNVCHLHGWLKLCHARPRLALLPR